MIPRYIRKNQYAFLMAKQLIREGKFWQAMEVAKSTKNRKLIQRLQQYSDSEFRRAKYGIKRNQST